jgi:formylglycine-generating enzyme required for sulfatase activity
MTMRIRLETFIRRRQATCTILALALIVSPGPVESQGLVGTAESLPRIVDNSLGMRLVLLTVGLPVPSGGRSVGIDRPVYMGVHEVTYGQLQAFLTDRQPVGSLGNESAPPRLKDPDEPLLGAPGLSPSTPRHPAQFMSWSQARSFADWLSAKEGRRYRLPTADEWEYACRAGATESPTGQMENGPVANIADRTFQQSYPVRVRFAPVDDGHAFAAPVGSYRANALGLHDMIGNVWEWVAEHPSALTHPGTSSERTSSARGGGFASSPERADCGARLEALPNDRYATTGFRLVLEATH